MTQREKEKGKEKDTHAHTYIHTRKRAHDCTHAFILWCLLKLDQVKGHGTSCIHAARMSLNLTHVPAPPQPPRPKTSLDTVLILHTHPIMPG